MTQELPKMNTLNKGFDDFAPLFVNWVNSILSISISSNLAKELEDGRIILLLINKLCPYLQLTDPAIERSIESNYEAIAFAYSKLGIPSEYYLQRYYYTNGNMGPVFTSLTILLFQLMLVVGERDLHLCSAFKNLIITTIQSIHSLRNPSLLPSYLEQLKLLDNDSFDLFADDESLAEEVWRSMLDSNSLKFNDHNQLLYYILFRLLGEGEDSLSRTDIEDNEPLSSLSPRDDDKESLSRLYQRYLKLSHIPTHPPPIHDFYHNGVEGSNEEEEEEEEEEERVSIDWSGTSQIENPRESLDERPTSLLSLLKSKNLLPHDESDDSLENMSIDDSTSTRRNNAKAIDMILQMMQTYCNSKKEK